MAEITRDRRIEILNSLSSDKCEGCGKRKPPMKSHCKVCYCKLPAELRMELYQKFGSGYEEAFEASLEYLKKGEAKEST